VDKFSDTHSHFNTIHKYWYNIDRQTKLMWLSIAVEYNASCSENSNSPLPIHTINVKNAVL